MKFILAPKSIFLGLVFIAFFHHTSNAQVGIGTVTPQGSLDIESTNQGVVLPRVVLSRTDTQTISNPQGVPILSGTVVYNTVTTIDGDYSVYPGIYVWIVDKWVPQFSQKQSVLIRQVGTDFRATNSEQNIPLTASTFTPEFSGTYRIELSVNFGGGFMRRPSSANSNSRLNVGSQTGNFKLTYNNGSDVDYLIPIKSYSARYRSGSNYYAIWKQQSIVFYVIINRGDTPTFNLSIQQITDTQFENSGNSSNGRGNVGDDIPCTIEIDFVGGV